MRIHENCRKTRKLSRKEEDASNCFESLLRNEIVNWKASVSQERKRRRRRMWRHFSIKNAPPSFPTCLGLRRATTDFCRRRGRLIGFPSLNFRSKNSLPTPQLDTKRFSKKTRRYLAEFPNAPQISA